MKDFEKTIIEMRQKEKMKIPEGLDLSEEVIFITGIGGSIATSLVKTLINFNPKKIIGIDVCELNVYNIKNVAKSRGYSQLDAYVSDLSNLRFVEELFIKEEPTVVFHCAAYKHLPLGEDNPRQFFENNVLQTWNILYLSKGYKIPNLIFLSTDKAVEPSSFMGMTKRLCELMIIAENIKTYKIVRFGNVLGSSGSLIPAIRRAEEQGLMQITDKDVERYFMFPEEAAYVLIDAWKNSSQKINVYDYGKMVNIQNLVKTLIDKPVVFHEIGLSNGEKKSESLHYEKEIEEFNIKEISKLIEKYQINGWSSNEETMKIVKNFFEDLKDEK